MRTFNKKSLLIGTLLSSAMMSVPAYAQDSGEGANDEIVVTGSRIQRSQDFIANSPVATVEAVQFERTGSVNTEDLLNSLPQTVPGLDSSSNNPGNGTATIDLRGLGANRTLVLVNGRRTQPTGAAGVVDINTISPALIENVEVLTGGASSVYGADAVSGVVNFILKDDFEGVEANIGYQMTDQGDAGLLDANVTLGANFDDGRGNATVSIGYTDRDELFQGDRDFSNISLGDDGDGGLEPFGSSGIPQTSIFGGGIIPGSAGVVFQPDGSVRPFVLGGDNNDFYNYAPPNYIRLPQERYTLAANADYEINEHFEVFVEGRFASNNVDSQLAPTPIFQAPPAVSLDGNPFLTAETQQLISDAFGDGVDTDADGIDDTFSGALLRRRLREVGPRFASDNRDTFQLVTGIRGAVNDSMDYEVFYSEGRTNNSSFQEGNVNRDRFNQALLLADADGDGNVDAGAGCADPSSNGSTIGCTPLNIFGEGNISPDAAAFLRTAVSTTDVTQQRVLQGNVFGTFDGIALTDNPVGYAFGAEYIENEFEFRPSQDVAASTIAGFNGAPPVAGEIDVYSAYGELSVPLLEGKSFAENVTLDLAGRVSDFSNGGTQFNYKVGGEWAVNDLLRFRGNFNTAVRAPNIGELFSPQGENFPSGEDPCSNAGMPNAATAAICQATGVSAAALGTVALDAVSGQVRALDGGNPDLGVEKAETITIGAVISPDLFDSFSLSVDYFNIQIEDAIATLGVNTVLQGCYTGPNGGAGSAFCNLVNRRPDSTIDFVSLSSTNIAGSELEGIDVAMNASTNTDFLMDGFLGDVSVGYLGTITLSDESQANPSADVFDCAGRFGNSCGEPNPSYRHYTTVGLSKGMLSTNLTWQMIGSVDEGADVNGTNDPDLQGFSVDEISARHYFDGSITADVSDNLALTFGARNIFDKQPAILGDNQEQSNTFPATYDALGRTFFANAKVSF